MKIKQLESLRSQHVTNLKRKDIPEPSIDKAIALALISGQPVALHRTAEVLEAARKVIADCSCHRGERTLKFSEVFAFKSDELTAYQQAKKRRDAMIRAYSSVADRVLRRAEMDDNYDATQASDDLAQAAHEAGLID